MEKEIGCDLIIAHVDPTDLISSSGETRTVESSLSNDLLPVNDTFRASIPHVTKDDRGITPTVVIQKAIEIERFVKDYVHWLFNNDSILSYEDKARFGELMTVSSARLHFAKYVDAQRSFSKCVTETTFYKLVHSFALALFECGEADDYLPGKSLMNMAFTYYHIPEKELKTLNCFGTRVKLSSSPITVSDKIIRQSDSVKKSDHSNKSFVQRMKSKLEQIFIQSLPSQNCPEHGFAQTRNQHNLINFQILPRSGNDISTATNHQETCVTESKVFLYEHLKNQIIWRSLRFWNAAFLSAVQNERTKGCAQGKWIDQSHTERKVTNESDVNITFGQLGTFINNMKCLGLDNKICMEFLRKQSIIGGIKEGGQYYKMLVNQIEHVCIV